MLVCGGRANKMDGGQQMFTITYGQGFRMEFENGWVVSVQWGLMNYCDRKLRNSVMLSNTDIPVDWNAPKKDDFWESDTAEIAAWYGEREERMGMTNWYNFGNDHVKGYCTADEVMEFIGMVRKLPSRILTEADYTESPIPDIDTLSITHS